jgi:hypothetical protein
VSPTGVDSEQTTTRREALSLAIGANVNKWTHGTRVQRVLGDLSTGLQNAPDAKLFIANNRDRNVYDSFFYSSTDTKSLSPSSMRLQFDT